MLMIREQSAPDRLPALRDLLGTDRQAPDRVIGSCYSPMRQLPQAPEPETSLGQFPH